MMITSKIILLLGGSINTTTWWCRANINTSRGVGEKHGNKTKQYKSIIINYESCFGLWFSAFPVLFMFPSHEFREITLTVSLVKLAV